MTVILNHALILSQIIHTIIFYSHPIIHLHASIPFHFHKCCESNVVVLTMMISLRSQIISQVILLHATTPSISLNQSTKMFTQFTERIFAYHHQRRFPWITFLSFFQSTLQFIRYIVAFFRQCKTTMTDQDANDILKLLPISSYKRERNLGNHLARASVPHPPMFSGAGALSCGRRRCDACRLLGYAHWGC